MTKKIIKFLTAGNVDDGKSTLIGRMLFDTKSLYQDQIAEIEKLSEKEIDFSLFVDGLTSEQNQKITIDVAYRYFSYQGRRFTIADAPGHQQYTKNMAVAAANSDIAIILIDATKGIQTQTIRHSYIAALFGIKRIIVAVNKMDLVYFDQSIFEEISNKYRKKTANLGFNQIDIVPIAAKLGDNIILKSQRMFWYQGKSIMENLLGDIKEEQQEKPLRLQIQNVNKDGNKRYYQAFLSNGDIAVNQLVKIYPANQDAKIEQIIHNSDKTDTALSITLNNDVDLERGGLVTDLKSKPQISNKINADLIWFSNNQFLGDYQKEYLIKINHLYIRGFIEKINHQIDIKTLRSKAANKIEQNNITNVDLLLSRQTIFDDFKTNKNTGSLLIIDKATNETMACGIIKNSNHNQKPAKNNLLKKLKNLINKKL